jgi:sugar lactone lactonase YvrE
MPNGYQLNQLYWPHGLHVDDDQTIYVADQANSRIMKWNCGATTGQVIADRNGEEKRM